MRRQRGIRVTMKTLCVVVVVLSLSSVCQPAPLACEALLKPLDSKKDLSGRWYFIAFSTSNCLVSSLLNAIFSPSLKVDITSTGTPNVYDATYNIKMYGHCENESSPFIYVNSNIFSTDEKNAPTGEPSAMLQSGCSDCIVLKDTDVINTFWLFSKRQTVTAAELREFEKQSECLGGSKPQVFDTDHVYQNCKSFDDDDDIDADFFNSMIKPLIFKRLKTNYADIMACIAANFPDLSEWAHQVWEHIW